MRPKFGNNKRKFVRKFHNTVRYQIPAEGEIDYKNFMLLQKFLNDRGKIVSRRVSGVSSRAQRQLTTSIKRARFLGLLTSGSAKR